MRLAFVSMETTRHVDTPGYHRFERIARLLAKRGHEVTIFCGQWWDDYRDEMVVDDLRYRGVTLGTAMASFVTRLPVMLARYRPDVVHITPSPPDQVLAAISASSLARAPLVVEWYGDVEPDQSHRRSRFAATRPDLIISPSEYVRTRVRERGATETNTTVIPESIDFAAIESVTPGEHVEVVAAERLDGNANLDDLLLGLAELREQDDWNATIVGDGPLRDDYEREVVKLRIDDRVTFVGDLEYEDRIRLYRGAHAFVQTAYRVNFPRELQLALAAGCVGIVEYQAESGAHELIENYERSFRVTNPNQLADAILKADSAFDHQTIDEHWQAYDHGTIVERYVDEYTALLEDLGWF